MPLAKTAMLARCTEEAEDTYRALMADPDLTINLRPWINEARRLDALRRARPGRGAG